MKPSNIALAAAATTAVSSHPLNVQKRELGGVSALPDNYTSLTVQIQVLMCTGANATGTCSYDVYPLNKCNQLSAPFLENTKTFAPDGEAFQCYPRLFDCDGICKSPTGCTFGAVDFDYENKYNLGALKWDTLIRSFDCIAQD